MRLRPGPLPWLACAALLAVAAAARLPGVYSRSIWYDEAITLIETSEGPASWPDRPRPAAELHAAFEGMPSLAEVTERLRVTDIHPPVYYWALAIWRGLLGSSIEIARLLSALLSIAAVAAFWCVLRLADVERPLLPAGAYALSTYAVHYGHEARGYALASLLLMAGIGAALASMRANGRSPRRTWAASAATSALLAGAFLTGYLTLFPSVALLTWFVLASDRGRRAPAVAAAATAPLLAGFGLFALSLQQQFLARPNQDVGFRGHFGEIRRITRGLGEVLCGRSEDIPWPAIVGLVAVLSAITLRKLRDRATTSPLERRFALLAVGLVVAPAAGLWALDWISDKRLADARYLLFSGPGLAYLVARGAPAVRGPHRWLARIALVTITVVMLTGLCWRRTDCRTGRSFGPYREVVRDWRAASATPSLAVVGTGFGRGDVWSWVYELPPEVSVIFLSRVDDVDGVLRHVDGHAAVWLLGASDRQTVEAEQHLREYLVAAGWSAVASRHYRGAFLLQK